MMQNFYDSHHPGWSWGILVFLIWMAVSINLILAGTWLRQYGKKR